VSRRERRPEARREPPGPSPTAAAGAIYVVAKAPSPGQTKTRLCPPLTPAGAALLARAFLLDVLDTVRASGLTARIICRDVAERAALRDLVGDATAVCVQEGSGLGDALESAFRQGLADGFTAVAVLGADVPTLRPEILQDACRAVAGGPGGPDVAVGLSDDGGYYLLAARAVHPALFRDMVWSTAGVAGETLRRCRAAGLRSFLLPPWYDVDDAAGLETLRADLAAAPPGVARRTRAVLATLAGALPEVTPPATSCPWPGPRIVV
jgi:rSAM/selenodomain-associated transferase 1